MSDIVIELRREASNAGDVVLKSMLIEAANLIQKTERKTRRFGRKEGR